LAAGSLTIKALRALEPLAHSARVGKPRHADPHLGQARRPHADPARPAKGCLSGAIWRAAAAPRCSCQVSVDAMNKHLADAGAIALRILDGAGWPSSARLIGPDNIVLVPLPPSAHLPRPS